MNRRQTFKKSPNQNAISLVVAKNPKQLDKRETQIVSLKQNTFKSIESANETKSGERINKQTISNKKGKKLKKKESVQMNMDLDDDDLKTQKPFYDPVPLKSRNFYLEMATKTKQIGFNSQQAPEIDHSQFSTELRAI